MRRTIPFVFTSVGLITRHADQAMLTQNVFIKTVPVHLLLMKVTIFMSPRSLCVSVGLFSHERCNVLFLVAFLLSNAKVQRVSLK